MAAPEYDALVVGARIAGSTVAARLAEQGRKVLLVDRDEFPSDTISTHGIGFNAVDSLRRLGVLDRIEAAGFRRIFRHRAWVEDISIEAPARPPGTYSIVPRRIVLDQILIDRAVECGAELWQRARVDGLLMESGAVVGAIVQHIGGEKRNVRARVVVGADGKQSQIAQWVGAEKYDERPVGRPIYYGYFHGVTPLAGPTIEMFFGADRIGFCLPMRPDEHCLVIEAQHEDFSRIRQNPTRWFRDEFSTLPGMADRLQHAQLEGRMLSARYRSWRHSWPPGCSPTSLPAGTSNSRRSPGSLSRQRRSPLSTRCSWKLYGLNSGIIDRAQFSILVTVVITSAIVPTLVAQRFFSPPLHKLTSAEEIEVEDEEFAP